MTVRIGVVGVGYFGSQHARVLSKTPKAQLAGVHDINHAAGTSIAETYGVPFHTDLRNLLKTVDAVSIAVPTAVHREVACECLQHGVAVLLEKPIAATLSDAAAIMESARKSNALLQIGHIERFNPAVIALRRVLTCPTYFEVHRLSEYSARSSDQDVVVDLMIHDIDIVLSIVKAPVAEVTAIGVPIVTARTDIANARLRFENGCVANLTAGRVYPERIRKLRAYQAGDYVAVDYSEQSVTINSVAGPREKPAIQRRFEAVRRAEPLEREIESFLDAVARGTPVEADGQEASRALEVALRVIQAISRTAIP